MVPRNREHAEQNQLPRFSGRPVDQAYVDELHRNLTPELRRYWHERLLTDDTINTWKLGYGTFNGTGWLTIPILDDQGAPIFLKLKRPPGAPESQPKGLTYPAGSKPCLYPMPNLGPRAREIVLCEGEPDTLLLMTHGILAVTSTHGAGTFEESWLNLFPMRCNVILCFDADEAGRRAFKRLHELFGTRRPDIRLATVNFPQEMIEEGGKDVTDFFLYFRKKNPALPSSDTPNA